MEIQRTVSGKSVLLDVSGKLDAYWSGALNQEIEACVHGGASTITLSLEHVDFISSAGLRVLLIWLKQMKAINGSFIISRPSPEVISILDMSGLSDLLLSSADEDASEQLAPEKPFAEGRGRYTLVPLAEVAGGTLEIFQPVAAAASGKPEAFPLVRYPSSRLGIGIGAFGDIGSGSASRLGEYISTCGVTVCLPTDGRGHPDYMTEDGVFVPSVSVYSGLAADARFSHSVLFEAADANHGVSMSDLATLALNFCSTPAAMLLMIAETAFLIGAALKTSPLDAPDPFTFPGVRENVSFTTEPTSENTISVVCGAVSSVPRDFLRPLTAGGGCHGHVHAISFSQRPLPSGLFDPQAFIRKLFDEERIQSVFHLLTDDRHASAVSESEFIRGCIWIHPLSIDDGAYQ